MRNMITMGEFIVKKQADYPTATGELTSLLSSIRLAAKVVNREINKAGLADIIGSIGARQCCARGAPLEICPPIPHTGCALEAKKHKDIQ